MNTTTTVSEFRNGTDHLFRVATDFHACRDTAERLAWLDRVETVIGLYDGQRCTRAKAADIEQRSRAIQSLRAIVVGQLTKAA